MCGEKRFAMRTFQKGVTFRIKRASTLKEKDGIIKQNKAYEEGIHEKKNRGSKIYVKKCSKIKQHQMKRI